MNRLKQCHPKDVFIQDTPVWEWNRSEKDEVQAFSTHLSSHADGGGDINHDPS